MGFAYKPILFDDLTAINPVAPVADLKTSLAEAASALAAQLPKGLLVLDGMPGATITSLVDALRQAAPSAIFQDVSQFYRSPQDIRNILAPYLPMDRESDPELIFGKLFEQSYEPFFDTAALATFLASVPADASTVLYGLGSASAQPHAKAAAVAFIDVTPKDEAWRVFAGQYQCLGSNDEYDLDTTVRQTYFVDNELAVNLRKQLVQGGLIDHYLLDSSLSFSLLSGRSLQAVCEQLKSLPLRAKPVYVEGVWGGQFLQRYRNVPKDLVDKVAWSFELIHTEASLLAQSGEHLIDIPFLTFMAAVAEGVIGSKLHARFGSYLPIRFNYDDTWHSNGNMSIQCHPNDAVARELYGDFAAQHEAYYVVLTGHGAATYCGFRSDADPHKFLELARQSEKDSSLVDYQAYIHGIPSSVGRQILLPAGTVHASGRNQLVLELGTLTMSAYTYKIYDYTRMDITGKPRPLHTKLGEQALHFERDETWVMENIAFEPRPFAHGKGWRELLIGQHEEIFFETHRIEMETGSRYPGDNRGDFCVLTVVDGEAVRIQSVEDPSKAYDAKYLDVILVPASLGRYEVIAQGKQPVVLHKAFVREDK
ncbi:MAG TPA: class I mannose-6-phosphate isomerase [Anaerolineales bacterium]|nr:class I mannose-6-phosphate isomerase [Anaerolineales bacterium]HRQ92752.1 class I mannose-6-phosphate isomerase [Anaerolineales bacterium]